MPLSIVQGFQVQSFIYSWILKWFSACIDRKWKKLRGPATLLICTSSDDSKVATEWILPQRNLIGLQSTWYVIQHLNRKCCDLWFGNGCSLVSQVCCISLLDLEHVWCLRFATNQNYRKKIVRWRKQDLTTVYSGEPGLSGQTWNSKRQSMR